MAFDGFNIDKFETSIDFSNIKGKNIVACLYNDASLYWVHSLTYDKKFGCHNDNWIVYYSKKFDLYFFYFTEKFENFIEELKQIQELNKVHFIGTFGHICNSIFDEIENTKDLPNVKYSILNYNSEIFSEDEPFILENYNNVSYIFSCTNLLESSTKKNPTWLEKNPHKFKLDFKYPLIYFYHKLGFNYFQKGEQQIEISNRLNKIFLYSKVPDKTINQRFKNIKLALDTNRIYEKIYTEEDWFWYFANYNYYHTPFVIDYNMCKFNLVMETKNVSRELESVGDYTNNFFSEKTLKALMVSTPSYVLLKTKTYQALKDYGFYFLNEDFQVINDEYFSYQAFCNFMKNCTDKEFNKLFIETFEKSKKNKNLVEQYIYSDKTLEIDLLIGNK
jgi:hypothetical protein